MLSAISKLVTPLSFSLTSPETVNTSPSVLNKVEEFIMTSQLQSCHKPGAIRNHLPDVATA
ncbi:unnamed protein product [Periconia digitata]|uniref:Uncharacterized protein n=1 Tax=Periconia digitata TaxID=1303443 RepID=A0A9W4UTR2_9PLEO|nr:unnamed protein product [Periconia digitata]